MTRVLLSVVLLTGCTDVVQHGAVASLAVGRVDCQNVELTAGADHWRLRVLQDGARFVEQTGTIAGGWPEEIGVPEAGAVQVRVEVFAGSPESGQLVGWGQSRLVAAGAPRAGETMIVPLALVNRFAQVCTRLVRARGGHTATVLGDDRVLLAGGFAPDETAVLASIEALAPFEATSSEVGELAVASLGSDQVLLPRARHAAVRVAPMQVLFWGGARSFHGASTSLSIPLVFDVEVSATAAFAPPQYAPEVRTDLALATLGSAIFVFGGASLLPDAGWPVTAIERVDLTSLQLSKPGGYPDARIDAALASTAEGEALFAGGTIDGGVSAEVGVVNLRDVLAPPWKGALATPRRRASAIAVGEGFLVAGGLDGQGADVASTEWVHLEAPVRVEPGPAIAPRAAPCLAALGDGRVLVLGGEANGQPSSAAELLSRDGTMVAVDFPGPPRRGHACTTLSDGSVLVTGGLTSGGVALDDAWRFVPEPPPLAP